MRRGDPIEALFKGRHFDHQIVILCVRWYLSYPLSGRNLVEMMSERGLSLVCFSLYVADAAGRMSVSWVSVS